MAMTHSEAVVEINKFLLLQLHSGKIKRHKFHEVKHTILSMLARAADDMGSYEAAVDQIKQIDFNNW